MYTYAPAEAKTSSLAIRRAFTGDATAQWEMTGVYGGVKIEFPEFGKVPTLALDGTEQTEHIGVVGLGLEKGLAMLCGLRQVPAVEQRDGLVEQLRALALHLTGATNSSSLFTGALFRRLFIMATQLHFAINAFALQLLLQSPKRLVYIIVANDNLHKKATLRNQRCSALGARRKRFVRRHRRLRNGTREAPLRADSRKGKEKAQGKPNRPASATS
jgi:hypothetical protein